MTIHTAAVAGMGMMGPGIAALFAVNGKKTILVSRSKEGALAGVETAGSIIRWMADNELIQNTQAEGAAKLLHPSTSPEDAAAEADLFVESIVEDIAIKQEYFARLDGASESTVLCSNTSGMSITQIASKCKFPNRVMTTHFWNPPHLVPLVEVIVGDHTDISLAQGVTDFLDACGKTAVLVRKDRPGQLGNRIQHAMVRECMNIVQEGIATAEDVDKAVKAGFGLRTPVYGVFEHADLVGLDLVKSVQDYVLPDLSTAQSSVGIHDEKVKNGDLGAKTGRGMLEWPPGKADEVKERRDAFLLDFLKRYGRKTD